MKSYDVAAFGEPLQLFERPTPQPTGSEVLLRTVAAGICHSDLHFWEGGYDIGGGKMLRVADRGIKLPLTMGHEIVGEVVALGPEAEGVAVGEKRLVFPWIGCGACAVCRRGDEQLCMKPTFFGVFRPGGYGDHVVVPHPRYLLDISGMDPAQAAPYACSGVTTYGALKKVGPALKDEPIAVIGAGGLGLMCLSVLKAMGGKGAIVVDLDPKKRQAALDAGALAAIDGGAPDAAKQVVAAANGGVVAAIDLVGSGGTVQLGIDCIQKGGKVIVVGLYGGAITIPTPFIPMKAMTVQGSYVGSLGELTELLDLVRTGKVAPIPVTCRDFHEADAALHELKAGKLIGRAVLTP